MKKLSVILMLAFTGSLLISSCSKEKQLERRLIKKDGEWKLATYTAVYFEDGVQVGSESYSNAGTFTFEKDGKGSYSFTVAGSTDSGTFTWSNTDNTITMDNVVYTLVTNEKKEISFKMTDTWTSLGVDHADEYTYNLKR